ncbi:MAG: penicillin-binding protein [Bacteroidales bacterium]|nr:penicillin-binding protein [Bacteroidales bacterium]
MKARKYRLLKIFLASIASGIALIVLLAGLLYFLVLSGAFGSLPGINMLADISNEEASLVFSSDSILIGKYFAENRTNITWDEIPEHLKIGLIETEDRRFYSHRGYDTRSYLRVFLRTILMGDESGGGGSTITQQLAKNLYGRSGYRILSLAINKMKEIIIARRLEEIYTKDELLLLYLNSVPFGEDLYGVESASQRYFNKPVSELKIEESAVLVGMLKATTVYNPQLNPENSIGRRNVVLTLIEKADYLDSEEADSLRSLPLELEYKNLNLESPAGYFVYQVRERTLELLDSVKNATGEEYNLEKDGLKIYTTLDMQVQELAYGSVSKHLGAMQQLLDRELEYHGIKRHWYSERKRQSGNYENDTSRRKIQLFDWDNGIHTENISRLDSLWHYYKMLNASVLIVNPKNGSVITWIGGNNFRLLPFDMALSHRQIASAFKPVLFATALELGIPPCKYLANEENEYPGYEDWEPQNVDLISTPDSSVALWYALAHSINLPTVDLYFQVGGEELASTCDKLKFPDFVEHVPSNALGTLDLSLYEIIRAYGAFANNGQMNELCMINRITDADGSNIYTREYQEPDSIFTEETSRIMTAILQQVVEQGTGSGIRNNYGIKADLAGKTGTAQNYSDAWFIAYTPEIVLGTWVGARTPDVHFYSENGTGASLAMPIIARIIKDMERNEDLNDKYLTSFDLPDDVYSFLDCDPFRQRGIRGFFNRLFGIKTRAEKEQDTIVEKVQEEKSLFEKLFGKKK